jgi:hypothetical protein
MGGQQGSRGRRQLQRIALCGWFVYQLSRPGRSRQLRVDRLPVLTPQLDATTQRNETAIISNATNAAEIVIQAEACRLCLMQKAEQDAPLTAFGRETIDPGQVTTTGSVQRRLRRMPDQRIRY